MRYNCIKCQKQYTSEDDEAYLCDECKNKKSMIAAQVDQQFAGRSKIPPTTDLQRYEQANKIHGFPHAKDFML